MTAGPGPSVTGQVIIVARCPPLADAAVHISLEDTSYADREATVLADLVVSHVAHPAGQDRATVVPFTLTPTRAVDPRHRYAVRVWVDGDGDGEAGPGDLHSDQHHPVLTRGHPSRVTIELSPAEGDPAPWR